MKLERTKNTVRNIVFGWVYKILTIILPFFTRTAILYVLGTEYLGLGSLFSSLLSFLALAEAGFGTAMIYSMYKPISENNDSLICALLNLYRRYYRIIGTIILTIGLLLMPFLRYLIKGNVPADVNLYVLYAVYLANTVSSYFLFAYKGSVLTAYQRSDVDSKINVVVVLTQYAIQIVAILVFKSFYIYILCLPVATIATNILRYLAVKKMYPNLVPKGEVPEQQKKDITKKVKALIGTKLNTVVLNASDNIVMSAFLGLTVIAIYNNYYYIMSALTGFLGICYTSMTAGLGNSLATETKVKNYNDFLKFSFINAWLVGWCAICLVCMYQPFMFIWTGEDLMFPFYMVLLIAVYFYLYLMRKIPVIYKDAGGIWWEDRFRPYVCMVVNLVSNIITVQLIGVAGIVISTILSLLISIPWENYTIFKYIFHTSPKEYYKKMAVYIVLTIGAGLVTRFACMSFDYSIMGLIIRTAICIVIPNAIWIVCFHKFPEYKEAVRLFKGLVKRRKA